MSTDFFRLLGDSLVNVLVSVLFALITFAFTWLLRWHRNQQTPEKMGLKERFAPLVEQLTNTSNELDALMGQLSSDIQTRTSALDELESQIKDAEMRDASLREQFDALQKAPPAVAEYFAQLTNESEKKSKIRDYFLFFAGVVFSVLFQIVWYLVSGD